MRPTIAANSIHFSILSEDIAWWLRLGAQIVAVGAADGFLANGTRIALDGFARIVGAATPG